MTKEFEDIQELLSVGSYSKAENKLKRINEGSLEPLDRIEWNYLFGICLFESGKLEQAIAHFNICLTIAKDNAIEINDSGINYEISIAYYKLFFVRKEAACLEKSINFCKKAMDTAINNSLVEQKSGFMVYYEESPMAYINMLIHLGVLHQTKEDLDESISLLLVAKTICQHYSNFQLLGQVYDELGTTYMMRGNQLLAGYYFMKSVNAKKLIDNKRGIEITLQKHLMSALRDPQSINSPEATRLQKIISEERI